MKNINPNVLEFGFGDLYPMAGNETSDTTVPEPAEQETLGQDSEATAAVTRGNTTFKNVLIAFGIAIVMIVFFGVGGAK